MIKRALVMLAALAAVTFSHAQQVSLTYQGGTGPSVPNVVDSTGTALPNSTLTVEVGYFTPTFDVAANENNLAGLESNWHQFDATDIITAFGVFPGAFSKTATSSDTQFNNQHIDLWVFKTSDNAAPNLVSFANVLEYGIFTRVNTSNPWQFPVAGPGITTMNIDTTQVDTAFHGLLNASSLELQAVPEPSSAAVLGLGAAVLVFLRRGRQ